MDTAWFLGGTAQALAASLLVACVLIRILLHGTATKGKMLPVPPRWPIIGHLHLLMGDKPLHLVLLRMGQKPTLVVSDANIARECITTHDRAFASRSMVALLSSHRLEMLSHVRDEETANCIKRLCSVWEASQKDGHKVQVGISLHMVDMVLEVIKRMVGGRSSLRLGLEEEFKEFVEEKFYVTGLPNLGDVLPVLAMKKLAAKLNVISQLWLDKQRQTRQGVAVDREKAVDFLDVMLSLSSDPQIASLCESTPHRRDMIIKATLLVIVFAAMDTSAVTLKWALVSLLSNPEAMRKVKEELDTKIGKERRVEEADIANLPNLQAIIKETLRLYPPSPLIVTHESMEDCVVAGFHVPASTRLIINAWKIQRDPTREVHRNEVDVKGQHFEFLPFGAGRRACPGMSLTLLVVHLALARLLHSFDSHLPLGCSSLDMTEAIVSPPQRPHLWKLSWNLVSPLSYCVRIEYLKASWNLVSPLSYCVRIEYLKACLSHRSYPFPYCLVTWRLFTHLLEKSIIC
ncbi:hypothetical protein AMTRI_Chr04g188840 [Amborella trichopoda]